MLKFLILLSSLVASIFAAGFAASIHSHGSLRAKMIREGTYKSFLEKQKVQNALRGGSSPLNYFSDDAYVINITVGTPPQLVTALLNTDLSHMFVLDADVDVNKSYRYDHTKSSTYVEVPSTQFIDQGVTGGLAYESMTFGTGYAINVSKQEFGLAEYQYPTSTYQYDGTFGLGWPYKGQITGSVLQTLANSLDWAMFTVWLDNKHSPSASGYAGQITFGGNDNLHCETNYNSIPLTTTANQVWQFGLNGWSMGTYTDNTQQGIQSSTELTWIGAPLSSVQAIAKLTQATYDSDHQFYVVPCNRTKLPDLKLNMNFNTYSILASEYVIDLGLPNGMCAITFYDSGREDPNINRPSWILGDTWFRCYCNVFSIVYKSIGFPKALH